MHKENTQGPMTGDFYFLDRLPFLASYVLPVIGMGLV